MRQVDILLAGPQNRKDSVAGGSRVHSGDCAQAWSAG